MSSPPTPPRAIYVHYPFCEHRCHYCDFSVTRATDPPTQVWVEAIGLELEWWFRTTGWSRPLDVDTVFVGGGTPSFLDREGPKSLRAILETRLDLESADLEWTVEANPRTFTAATARAWRRAGANRVSLGVQAFDDSVLRWLGRLHSAEEAEAAVTVARSEGYDNVSIDLMFGLPRTVTRDLGKEARRAVDLGVDHVSAYGLTIEPRTPLARRVEMGEIEPAGERAYAEQYRIASTVLREAGFDHYEVSNFARPGRECRHNWYYWNRSAYLGLGPSAHGFLPPTRVWNVFRWDRYLGAVRADEGAVEGREELAPADVVLERLWLGLRTRAGVDVSTPEWREALGRRLDSWVDSGWVTLEGDRAVATLEGWLRLDELVAEVGRDAGTPARPRSRGDIVEA